MPGIDNSLDHLYPKFRVLVDAVLKQVTEESGWQWEVFEGFRSRARQTALYNQGRTTPGAIVTNMKTPKHHGFGLAADLVWLDHAGRPRWDGSDELWNHLGHAARSQKDERGLSVLAWGGDWTGGLVDKPHIEPVPELLNAWVIDATRWKVTKGLV